MKLLKIVLIGIVLLVAGYFIFIWWSNRNHFYRGENGSFTIKTDETIQIELDENATTGYQNCWTNSNECENVVLVSEKDSQGPHIKTSRIGSGGRVIFTFKGVKKGIDTIAITNCLKGGDNGECCRFSVDSLKPDNLFVVEVE